MRRTIILFFIALVLVLGAAFIAFYLAPQDAGEVPENEQSGFFGGLFPFNFGNGGEGTSPGNREDLPLVVDERPVPALRQVSSDPTSGGFVYKNAEDEYVIRYIDRTSGHTYDIPAEGRAAVRISNTTIPEIHNVLWKDERNFIIRYLDDEGIIQNFFVTLKDASEDQSIEGLFLDGWVRGSVDSLGENLLAVYENSGGSTLTLSDLDGARERAIFSSPIRSWVPLQSNNSLYVYSAPASSAVSVLYRIQSGALTRVLGDRFGMLASVSPSGRYILTSSKARDSYVLELYDTETQSVLGTFSNVFADKCVFMSEDPVEVVCGVPQELPRGNYPDDWLLGSVSFTDDIWVFNFTDGFSSLIAVPEDDVNTAIDVWRPALDASGTYFTFINKKDLSYWSLRLKELSQENVEEDIQNEDEGVSEEGT